MQVCVRGVYPDPTLSAAIPQHTHSILFILFICLFQFHNATRLIYTSTSLQASLRATVVCREKLEGRLALVFNSEFVARFAAFAFVTNRGDLRQSSDSNLCSNRHNKRQGLVRKIRWLADVTLNQECYASLAAWSSLQSIIIGVQSLYAYGLLWLAVISKTRASQATYGSLAENLCPDLPRSTTAAVSAVTFRHVTTTSGIARNYYWLLIMAIYLFHIGDFIEVR